MKMALQSLPQLRTVGCRQQAPRRVAVCAASRQQQPSTAAWGSNSLAAAVIAAGATASLLFSPMPAVAASSLADVLRPEFSFVDKNKDGKVSMDEMVAISKEVSSEEGFAEPPEEQLSFAMRLFDLNQDGTVTLDETLQALALDAGVSEDAVDTEVMAVFDANNDNIVTEQEFKSAMPDVGPNSDALKDYVFRRVDRLGNGDGKLDVTEFGNAFSLFRSTVMGY